MLASSGVTVVAGRPSVIKLDSTSLSIRYKIQTNQTLADEERNKINDGYYPLNLKGNNKVCTKWKKFLQEQRKKYK